MSKNITLRPSSGHLFRLALVAALVIVLPVAAGATVPGQNGRIAFQTNAGGPAHVAVVDSSGAGLRPLTPDQTGQPAWSPDGTKIAYTASTQSGMRVRILDFFADASIPLTSGEAVADSNPAWSPDGTKVAFTRCGGDPSDCDIWVVNADGTNPVNLTQHPDSEDTMASWSPDGTKIAFSSTRNGNAEIFVMNADGTGQTGLTVFSGQDLSPDWSPDGTKILFARHDTQGVSQVWVMSADGTGQAMLGAGDQPVFSPDGTKIAFIQELSTGRDLWVMNADGSGAASLVASPADESSPSWQPINPGSNVPPVANAGPDVTFTCDSAQQAARLDGSASTDPDSTPGTNDDIRLYEWWVDFGLPTELFLGTGETKDQLGLPSGTYNVTLQVTDSKGQTSTDSVVINIVDHTPPQVSVHLSPSVIWPPNHKMVQVRADVTAFDFCGPATVLLESVSSNEAPLATGSGHFAPDITGANIGTPDFKFSVRAERSGSGSGRIYTAVYQATDPSGNTADASGQVLVPHDQSGKNPPPPPPGGGDQNHGKGWNKGKGNGNGNGNGNGWGNGKH